MRARRSPRGAKRLLLIRKPQYVVDSTWGDKVAEDLEGEKRMEVEEVEGVEEVVEVTPMAVDDSIRLMGGGGGRGGRGRGGRR